MSKGTFHCLISYNYLFSNPSNSLGFECPKLQRSFEFVVTQQLGYILFIPIPNWIRLVLALCLLIKFKFVARTDTFRGPLYSQMPV